VRIHIIEVADAANVQITVGLEVDLINKVLLSHILEVLLIYNDQGLIGNSPEFPLLPLQEHEVLINIEFF